MAAAYIHFVWVPTKGELNLFDILSPPAKWGQFAL
jgi:hypothetical protein